MRCFLWTRVLVLPLAFAAASSLAADDKPSVTPVLIQSAEEKYSSECNKADALVSKAEAEGAKARKAAGDVRLKAYKDRLVEVTKAGDFDKAVAVKARIEQLERELNVEPEKPMKRPRPKETIKFQGHAYALIKDPATWHVAQHRCEEMGGHLVTVESNAELEFILGITQANNTEAWIGGTDEVTEGVWKWVTGATIPKEMVSAFRIDNHQDMQHALAAGGSKNIEDNFQCLRRVFICEWDR